MFVVALVFCIINPSPKFLLCPSRLFCSLAHKVGTTTPLASITFCVPRNEKATITTSHLTDTIPPLLTAQPLSAQQYH
eukprot:scaffold5400_cov105-Skeletonema_dohrnii-CCMP3373.AAC.4